MTEVTLEENLLTTLSSKRDLAMAALDPESQITEVDVRTQANDIKEKLEILLGAKPDAPVDESSKQDARTASDRLANVGGSFLRAALDLVSEISGGTGDAEKAAPRWRVFARRSMRRSSRTKAARSRKEVCQNAAPCSGA